MNETLLNPEQRMLADSVLRYIERGYGDSERDSSLGHPHGCRPEVWRDFGEFGWLALPLSEADGGLGGSLADVCVVAEGLGRGAVTEPFIACAMLAARLLAQVAPAAVKAQWLPSLAEGDRRVAFADATESLAVGPGEECLLEGEVALVPGGAGAEAYLLAADTGAGDAALFLLEPGTAGLTIEPCQLYDGQGAARLRLERVAPGAALWRGPAADLRIRLDRALAWATVAHCAETVGAMQVAFEITLDYLKTRQQFGKPLSANQVLQHRLVDLMVAIEEARALTHAAAAVLDDEKSSDAEWRRYCAATKACVAQAARLVWKESVQLHGAIGMTQEYRVGQYVKRLAAATLLFGSAESHLERLAEVSLDPL